VECSSRILFFRDLALRPAKYYEFPDGYNHGFLSERFRIPEILFKPKEHIIPAATDLSSGQISHFLGLHELIQKSLNHCDTDSKALICSNILLHGGSSLFPGLSDRLSNELFKLLPAQKFKVIASNNGYERKYAPWIGGSILASLGSFQQLWMSKAEFDEHGAAFVEKRCHL